MKKGKKTPQGEKAPLMEIMIERGKVFGYFLTDLVRRMRYGIKNICRNCGISETHTFRAKMEQGIGVDLFLYDLMYVALKSALDTSHTEEARSFSNELEKNHDLYLDVVPRGVLR